MSATNETERELSVTEYRDHLRCVVALAKLAMLRAKSRAKRLRLEDKFRAALMVDGLDITPAYNLLAQPIDSPEWKAALDLACK